MNRVPADAQGAIWSRSRRASIGVRRGEAGVRPKRLLEVAASRDLVAARQGDGAGVVGEPRIPGAEPEGFLGSLPRLVVPAGAMQRPAERVGGTDRRRRPRTPPRPASGPWPRRRDRLRTARDPGPRRRRRPAATRSAPGPGRTASGRPLGSRPPRRVSPSAMTYSGSGRISTARSNWAWAAARSPAATASRPRPAIEGACCGMRRRAASYASRAASGSPSCCWSWPTRAKRERRVLRRQARCRGGPLASPRAHPAGHRATRGRTTVGQGS